MPNLTVNVNTVISASGNCSATVGCKSWQISSNSYQSRKRVKCIWLDIRVCGLYWKGWGWGMSTNSNDQTHVSSYLIKGTKDWHLKYITMTFQTDRVIQNTRQSCKEKQLKLIRRKFRLEIMTSPVIKWVRIWTHFANKYFG